MKLNTTILLIEYCKRNKHYNKEVHWTSLEFICWYLRFDKYDNKKANELSLFASIYTLINVATITKKIYFRNKFWKKKNGACVFRSARIFPSLLAGKLKIFQQRLLIETMFFEKKKKWRMRI